MSGEYAKYRPGSVIVTETEYGDEFVVQPGEPLFSTACFAASHYVNKFGDKVPIYDDDESEL